MPSDVQSTTSNKGGEVSRGASASVQSDRARDRRPHEERSTLYYDVEVPRGSTGLDEGFMALGDIEQMSNISEQMSNFPYDATEQHRSGQSYLNRSRPSPMASVASAASVASSVTIESYTQRVERTKTSSRFETVPTMRVTFSPHQQLQPDLEIRPRRQSSVRLPRSPPLSSIRLPRSPPLGEFELPRQTSHVSYRQKHHQQQRSSKFSAPSGSSVASSKSGSRMPRQEGKRSGRYYKPGFSGYSEQRPQEHYRSSSGRPFTLSGRSGSYQGPVGSNWRGASRYSGSSPSPPPSHTLYLQSLQSQWPHSRGWTGGSADISYHPRSCQSQN